MRESRFAVVVLVTSLGCGGGPPPTRASPSASLPEVVVVRPERKDLADALTLPGSLTAFEVAALHARVAGYLREVRVDIGDRVQEEQVLAVIATPETEADLAKAQADVGAARARLAKKQAELDLARLTHERMAALQRTEAGAMPRQEVDTAEARTRVAGAEVQVAQADIAVAAAAVRRLQTLMGYATLRAPFSGVVTERRLHPGALVAAGGGAAYIVEVARSDRLRVGIDVPESVVPHVAVGSDVVLTIDAFPGREWSSKVARLAGVLHPETRAMRAEIDVDNAEGALRPGMFANVRLAVSTLRDALAVPSRAVRNDGSKRFVYVVRDGVARRRDVVVASDDGRSTAVAGGLELDDPVVVAGSLLIADGLRVAAREEGSR